MAQPMDEDNDVQMSTDQQTTTNIQPTTTDTTTTTITTNTDNTNNTNDQKSAENPPTNPSAPINIETKEEEKQQVSSQIYEIHPLQLVQSAMSDFLNEMSTADIKATQLYQNHILRQQQLMNQFVADSLRLMHDFNISLHPIHSVLKKLKQPLQDVLLNRYISVPCEHLDEITKKQKQTMYNQSWGVAPVTHKYNKKNKITQNPHLQSMDLGAVINSLKDSIKLQKSNDNKQNNKEEINDNENENENDNTNVDSPMQNNDNITDNNNNVINENDIFNQAVLEYLNNLNNITSSQQDLVLKFFNTARAEQQRLEIKQQQQLAKLQREQRQKEQREAGANMLLAVLPWLTLDQAMVIMEMKSDIIEQATDHAMNTDQLELFMQINDWKKKHPMTNNNDNDVMMNNNNNNNNNNTNNIYGQQNLRSNIDMRVMNRSATTGETKGVTFRCTNITDDGQITLQAILDRNNIPLDPMEAKLLFISVSDLMSCAGVRIENEQSIILAQNERILSIVFQVVKQAENDMEFLTSQLLNNNQWRQRAAYNMGHYGNRQTEFTPIQFQPRCRDLEYELDFEDKTPPNNSCLKSVKHRMDGPVLFKGIYDDGAGLHLIGTSVDQPIDIYTEIIDDVTHNIICIIFENDLRDNVVIDVKNISFTEQTLEHVINDSEKDFAKEDMAGNKISYRIIVKDKSVIGILTKFGNKIKKMAYIEHSWMKEGQLVNIPNRNMLGIIKCIPTGLIVTNNPYKNLEKKCIKYKKNVYSKILRKHCADLVGFIDVNIVKEGTNNWREIDNPLCQSFAVTDIKPCNDNDMMEFIQFKQLNQTNCTDEINNLIKMVESDFGLIKDKNDTNNKGELLKRCVSNVKQLQELLSGFKNRKSNLNDDEGKFVIEVNDKINKFNREIRALRFEVKMNQ